uniref:Metalloendopeptidase n=1 Tax=Anopheles atroparvus TaxID=41427 RepID=A0AAG5DJQ6_ANOAO
MKLLCVMLCVALACSESSGTPVKRNSPTEMEMATSLEELGGNFEGDIVLSPEQQSAVEYGYTTLIGERYKWPDSIVPFQIDINAFTRVERDNIVSAMREIELVSCVRFVSRTTETDYIMVTGAKDSGCWSFLGHRGGMQTLNLQPDGCMARGTIIHELLHSLGFVHMQSASDRDFYVQINWDAIPTSKASNFNRYSSNIIEDFGIPYDYDSVMHYGSTMFNKGNGEETIVPKRPGVIIGQRVGLSSKDVKRLNYLYSNCF